VINTLILSTEQNEKLLSEHSASLIPDILKNIEPEASPNVVRLKQYYFPVRDVDTLLSDSDKPPSIIWESYLPSYIAKRFFKPNIVSSGN
jgi:hypothetical protein